MPDAVTHGQFKKFLTKHHFVAKGKKQNRYIGFIEGKAHIITFHYHKDNDTIPSGTLSAIARQLGMTKADLINKIKNRQ